MKIPFWTLAACFVFYLSCKNNSETKIIETAQNFTEVAEEIKDPNINILPVSHATMVLEWDTTIFYIDPVGGADAFSNHQEAQILLITDIHGDHLNVETLEAVTASTSKIIAPSAVFERLSENLKTNTQVLKNDENLDLNGFKITAVPMYNLREEALQFHEKGRGNGYIIEKDDYRIYISGDTEDIPEMRSLKNIDLAFVCMNLPFTMTVESAASAVIDFKPKRVVPYHYRGRGGFSDVDTFERLVNENAPEVEVKRIDFYPVD